MEAIKKFVVIGPESTGKSTLCSQLAAHYHTGWVPEYAREYLEKNGMDYSYDDLLTIAKGQVELEESFNNPLTTHHSPLTSHPSPLLFIDTDMHVMKVWCEYVFNKCHNWVLNRIAERHYDGYLLCNVDLPWVKDSLREYPDLENRKKLYYFYKDLMVNQCVPWIDIHGNYDERLERAINFIEKEK
jgi:NadR type nicotinamide-nucleotide adenylyltransferase